MGKMKNLTQVVEEWVEAVNTQRRLQEILYREQGSYPGVDLAYIAAVAELGEFLNAVKPLWAWWKRNDKKLDLDRSNAIEELADVLHFVLIIVLLLGGSEIRTRLLEEAEQSLKKQPPIPIASLVLADFHELLNRAVVMPSKINLLELLEGIPTIGSIFVEDFKREDLLNAYYKKVEKNIKRWKTRKKEGA